MRLDPYTEPVIADEGITEWVEAASPVQETETAAAEEEKADTEPKTKKTRKKK